MGEETKTHVLYDEQNALAKQKTGVWILTDFKYQLQHSAAAAAV